MKLFVRLCIILLFVVFPVYGSEIFAATLEIPERVKPGEMFIVRIEPENDKKILIRSEAGKVQFMGAVQGSPDIQMRSETLIEIEPADEHARCYELKFLAPGISGESTLSVVDHSGQRDFKIVFFAQKPSRNYSWFILAGGIILLVLGIKIWRYQKSSPNMMSTKSLFLNYEELEKARKKFFDDKTSEKPAKIIENTEPDIHNDQADSTRQRNSVKPVKTVKISRPAKSSVKASDNSDVCIVIAEPNGNKIWKAQAKNIKIGRRRDNQIVLTGSEISREHVEIFVMANKIKMRALTQSNITRLDGKDVTAEVEVRPGSVLNLGGTDFVVQKADIN